MTTATRISDLALLLRYLLPLWAVIILLGAWQNYYAETRWVRDALHLTPFTDVIVDGVRIDGGRAYVWGTMVKRRCRFDSLYAYVRTGDVLYPADIDLSPEDGQMPPRSRPPSDMAQAWGQWVITPRGLLSAPRQWRIYASHICPEDGGQLQTNLFAAGDWHNFDRKGN